MGSPGELAIVLHTHMPYVEGGGSWPPADVQAYMTTHGVDFETAIGQRPSFLRNPEGGGSWPPPDDDTSDWANAEGFGTWPFGEELLWEAVASCYLPLLEVLDELGAPRVRETLTLSLTPVLADQLEAPGAPERCFRFLTEIRPESHSLDIDAARRRGDQLTAAELERSAEDYAWAAARLERLQRADPAGGLVQALGAHATWTSSATHAILPLLALVESIDLQIDTGIESHRRRFGEWDGGFWLPECAYAPWLDTRLRDHGVRATCIELTPVFGSGDERHLHPLQPEHGPVLVPIDRETIDLVWGVDGYPTRPAYRDHHHLSAHHHRAHANDGSPYDRGRAEAQARADAGEFVTAVRRRVADGGLCVCALDTELLGHWWHEGPRWLAAVVEEAERQGLGLTALDDNAIERHSPRSADLTTTTSWGTGYDLRTWSGPAAADLAWTARTAELQTFSGSPPSERALRELMALQASDWAFMVSYGWGGDYPKQRASWHAAQLQVALRDPNVEPHLRNLAPFLA